VVKVISHKAASRLHMDGSIVFASLRQCVPSRKLNNASLVPSESTCQTTSRSVQPFCRTHDCDRHTDR